MKLKITFLTILISLIAFNFADAQTNTNPKEMTPQQWVEWVQTLPIEKLDSALFYVTEEQYFFDEELMSELENKNIKYKVDKKNKTLAEQEQTLAEQEQIIEELKTAIKNKSEKSEILTQELIENLKKLASLTSVEKVWQKFGDDLTKIGISKQDLED